MPRLLILIFFQVLSCLVVFIFAIKPAFADTQSNQLKPIETPAQMDNIKLPETTSPNAQAEQQAAPSGVVNKQEELPNNSAETTPNGEAQGPGAVNTNHKSFVPKNWFTKIPSPKRMAVTTIGFAGGLPIAVTRQSKREIMIAAKDLVGETHNPVLLAPATVFSTPVGIISGCLYGTYAALADSWVNSETHPFTRDFFSLGDLK